MAASLTALLIAPTAGCKDVVQTENRGTDNGYLRAPDEKPRAVTMRDGNLFPHTLGDHWVMSVKIGDRIADENITVSGRRNVPGTTATGFVLETSHNGKVDRQEVYTSDARGISLAEAGAIGDMMTISPPLPLLRKPLTQGDAVSWTGILHYRNTTAPGTALSRVSGTGTIRTLAGSFGAYRVDTIISTMVQGQPVSFPTTRWFAPGVGVVRQKLLAGQTIVLKDLKNFHVNPATADNK